MGCWILQRMSNPEINAVEAEADPDNAASQGGLRSSGSVQMGKLEKKAPDT